MNSHTVGCDDVKKETALAQLLLVRNRRPVTPQLDQLVTDPLFAQRYQ